MTSGSLGIQFIGTMTMLPGENLSPLGPELTVASTTETEEKLLLSGYLAFTATRPRPPPWPAGLMHRTVGERPSRTESQSKTSAAPSEPHSNPEGFYLSQFSQAALSVMKRGCPSEFVGVSQQLQIVPHETRALVGGDAVRGMVVMSTAFRSFVKCGAGRSTAQEGPSVPLWTHSKSPLFLRGEE